MTLEKFPLSPAAAAFLKKSPLEPLNTPHWYHETSSPLTFEVFCFQLGEGSKIYAGNSGLALSQSKKTNYFTMEFWPNGDDHSERNSHQDALQNAGIWAAGFQAILNWLRKEQAHNFSHVTRIEGTTHRKMFVVRQKLLESIHSTAMRESDIADPLLRDRVHYYINLKRILRDLQKAAADSLFMKLVKRTEENKEGKTMVNPRLSAVHDVNHQIVGYDF